MKPVAKEFVLEIEKYLDHLVNETCNPYDGTWPKEVEYGPPPFNEAVGIPIVLLHHRKLPEHVGAANYKTEYFMLDFDDFLEYATSTIATSFQIDSVPHNHCYYYQALPGSFEKPLFANKYGRFSVMGAALSRFENNLWIITQFKIETEESLRKATKITDLVTGTNFFSFFLTLHLIDERREAFSSDEAFAVVANKISSDGENIETGEELQRIEHLVEFTKSRLTPPFDTDYREFRNNEWGLMNTGQMWSELYGWWLPDFELEEDAPREMVEFHQLLLDRIQWLKEWQDYFEKEIADQFEIARLMRFLPSYFDFMYDLVITEKKEVGHKVVRMLRRKKKKIKVVRKPIYKIIKSLRVSYLAEEETRQKLKIPQRTWTAPSYQYAVRGHWRQLSQSSWIGHDQEGKKLIGKTWIKDHVKGPQIEPLQVETRTPDVIIKLKQTLSYARDVIKSHEALKKETAISENVAGDHASKPSKEWMYQERIKLTAGLRWIILKRDDFRCCKCGRTAEDGAKLQADHIIPIEKWGRTEESNLMTLCRDCNLGKGTNVGN